MVECESMNNFNKILQAIIAIALVVIAVVLLLQYKNSGVQNIQKQEMDYPSSIKYMMQSDKGDTGRIYTFTFNRKTYYGIITLSGMMGALGTGTEFLDSNGIRVGGCNPSLGPNGNNNSELCVADANSPHVVIWTNPNYHPIVPNPNDQTQNIPATVSSFIGQNNVAFVYSLVYNSATYYQVSYMTFGTGVKYFDSKGESAGVCNGSLGPNHPEANTSQFCYMNFNNLKLKVIWHNPDYKVF